MNKEKLKKLSNNPDNIEGIYNFCDRWCERCTFTSKCLSYQMEVKRREELYKVCHTEDENELFWKTIRESFEMALELVREFAEKKGVNLDDLQEPHEIKEKRNSVEKMIKTHQLVTAADNYLEMATSWMDNSEHLFVIGFDEKSKEYFATLKPNYDHLNGKEIADAFSVINWYQYQISVKLSRAIHSREMGKLMDETGESAPPDANGSAKVALIGIDRSIGAWSIMLKNFPEEEEELLNILVFLEQLCHSVEKEFPEARSFIRRGFDD